MYVNVYNLVHRNIYTLEILDYMQDRVNYSCFDYNHHTFRNSFNLIVTLRLSVSYDRVYTMVVSCDVDIYW